jgi:uncharacterized membrane protein
MEEQATSIEQFISSCVQWLRLGIETIGAIIIGVGVVVTIYRILKTLLSGKPIMFNQSRINLARYLALGLEFQLGADILSTAIAPTWTQIGKLGAIAVIRTALNFFLTREMREEREQIRAEQSLNEASDLVEQKGSSQ